MSGLWLITGGNGLIGREVVSLLAKRGDRVRVLDCRPVAEPLEDVEYITGDIRNPEDTDRACDGVDFLVHLAAVDHDEDGELIRDININGTASLLESAALTGIKNIVFASSTLVYGSPPAEVPCHEENPLISSGSFSLSKIIGEEMCLGMRESCGAKAAVIRPPIVLGPGYDDPRILEWIVDRAINNQPVFVFGGGETLRHYVDIGDCARAFIMAAEDPASDGHCFNIGFDKPHSDESFTKAVIRAAKSFSVPISIPQPILEIGARASRIIGHDLFPPELTYNLNMDAYFTTDKIRALLDWKPEKRLPVTLFEFMRWYKRKKLRESLHQ